MTSSAQPATMGGLWQKVLAEAIGTFALVFAGCGAIMVNHSTGGVLGHEAVSLTFGLVVMVMIYATGHISGAHFNPAVTVAFAVAGRFSWREVPIYIVGQLAAATVAALALQLILGSGEPALGATTPAAGWLQSLLLEGVISFFLMFVIIAVATDARAEGQMAGLAIGGTVALCALFAGPISGASMNPARSLGPALVAGVTAHQWLYVVGPLIGAALGALAYSSIRCSDAGPEDAGGCC